MCFLLSNHVPSAKDGALCQQLNTRSLHHNTKRCHRVNTKFFLQVEVLHLAEYLFDSQTIRLRLFWTRTLKWSRYTTNCFGLNPHYITPKKIKILRIAVWDQERYTDTKLNTLPVKQFTNRITTSTKNLLAPHLHHSSLLPSKPTAELLHFLHWNLSSQTSSQCALSLFWPSSALPLSAPPQVITLCKRLTCAECGMCNEHSSDVA